MKLVWSPETASKAYIETVQSVSIIFNRQMLLSLILLEILFNLEPLLSSFMSRQS